MPLLNIFLYLSTVPAVELDMLKIYLFNIIQVLNIKIVYFYIYYRLKYYIYLFKIKINTNNKIKYILVIL